MQTYRVVLYGHVVDDQALFCRRLAAALNISEELARKRAERKPVILEKGLSKQSAENLNQLLTSIGGLCLVQPEGNAPADSFEAIPGLNEALKRDSSREKRSGLSSNATAVVIGVLGVAILVGTVFLAQMKLALESKESPGGTRPYNPAQPPVVQAPEPSTGPAQPLQSRTQLREQIAALEPSILETRQRLQLLEKELRDLYESPMRDKEPFRQKQRQIRETRVALQSYLSRVRSLQKELRYLDRLEKESKASGVGKESLESQ